MWHNFVKVGHNWIKMCNLAKIGTHNRCVINRLKILNRLWKKWKMSWPQGGGGWLTLWVQDEPGIWTRNRVHTVELSHSSVHLYYYFDINIDLYINRTRCFLFAYFLCFRFVLWLASDFRVTDNRLLRFNFLYFYLLFTRDRQNY